MYSLITEHGVLCLDDANVMQANTKGGRIALITAPQKRARASMPLVIAVHLSNVGRPILLSWIPAQQYSFLFEPPDTWRQDWS
jgi:hypothetical protein